MDCGNPTSNLTVRQIQYLSGSSPAVTTYLNSVVIKCLVGFRWTDNILLKNITCLATGFWSSVVGCVGIFYKNSRLIFS